MALRVMLVGLVASLGLELPDGREFTGWLRSGQTWLSARWESVEGWMSVLAPESGLADDEGAVGAEVMVAGDVPVGPIVGTEAVDGLGAIRGDSPSIEIVETGEDRAEAEDAAFASVVGAMATSFAAGEGRSGEVGSVLGDVAYELNRISDGVDDGWMWEEGERESRPVEVAEVSAVGVAPEAEVEARSERLGTAVRLTGQAWRAWMSVLQRSEPIRVTER
jgi:hypothetical protein